MMFLKKTKNLIAYLSNYKIILFLAGFNSILLQYLLLKEIPSSLFSTEITVLLTLTSYFLGFSIGYFLSGKLSLKGVKFIIILLLPIHTFIVYIIRILAFFFLQVKAVWLILSFFISSFFFCSLYSIFLPLFLLKIKKKIQESVSSFYSLELIGSFSGSLLILLLQFFSLPLFFVYILIFYILVFLLLQKKSVLFLLSISFILLTLISPYLNKTTLEVFYSSLVRDHLKLISSSYSPYHRIDVLIDDENNKYLFLDGIIYFNSHELEDFNTYLVEIPLQIKKNVSDVLIIGGGTLSSAFHASKYALNITVVELDPGVIFTAKKYFREFNHFNSISNKVKIVVDDGKHYLMNTDKNFDVIIVDVPYPWNIQTALLYSTDFYQIIKTRLKKNGMFVTHLGERLQENSKTPKKIVKSISEVFQNYIEYSFKNLKPGFIMASDDFRISRDMIYLTSKNLDIGKPSILEKKEIDEISSSLTPITIFNLDVVIDESFSRI